MSLVVNGVSTPCHMPLRVAVLCALSRLARREADDAA